MTGRGDSHPTVVEALAQLVDGHEASPAGGLRRRLFLDAVGEDGHRPLSVIPVLEPGDIRLFRWWQTLLEPCDEHTAWAHRNDLAA